ncbi:HlyD family efflux transporter periplasmic adaptor subunit [Yoonia algicola]|uniref:HlyD family efflux transporter periplasmic adaptor subunit n=1 Tax=Yoonia algicola TaxID=3137368 RepID=A0AAN0MHZ0_9RHOB
MSMEGTARPPRRSNHYISLSGISRLLSKDQTQGNVSNRPTSHSGGRSKVVAPVSGTILTLHYHTAAGVIESGKPIAEILPTGEPLIIEVSIPRTEVDVVQQGQGATVRLTGLNARTTPILEGQVFYVSADSILDNSQELPQEVYVARVSVAPSQLERVRGFTPTPGMPAEIMIQTEERTFFEYLIRPISDRMNRAFREQ